MKRHVEVSCRSGGRTITKRYPARSVGTPRLIEYSNDPVTGGVVVGHSRWTLANALEANFDMRCTRCSYTACPCAPPPPQPVAPVPPADVLPDGWTFDPPHNYLHVTRAEVSRREIAPGLQSWCWWPASSQFGSVCCDPKPTRDAAMAAALASVPPAEPALRPGWFVECEFDGRPMYGRIRSSQIYWNRTGWRVMGDGGPVVDYPTLEAAMIRAEELARGEP